MLKRGFFITFEGGEGSGKSTQIRYAASYLRRKGGKVVVLREPGSTRAGEAIRRILLNPEFGKIEPETELLLYLAARAQLVKEKILPALRRNKIVICDRFEDSTIAYQAFGRGIPESAIEQMSALARGSLKPDLTFLLDLDPEAGMKRRGSKDRMELESLRFHKKVREGFRAVSKKEKERFVVIRGDLTRREIQAYIKEKLDRVFK